MNTYHFDSFIAIPWFIAIPLTALLILKCFELLLRVVKSLNDMPYSHEDEDDSNEREDDKKDAEIRNPKFPHTHNWKEFESGHAWKSFICENCGNILDTPSNKIMTVKEYYQTLPLREENSDICFADPSHKHLWGQYDSGRSQRCANCHLIWDSLTDGLMTLEEYEQKYYPH